MALAGAGAGAAALPATARAAAAARGGAGGAARGRGGVAAWGRAGERRGGRRLRRVAARAGARASGDALAARDRLLDAVEGTRRGAATTPAARAAIEEAVDELERLGKGKTYTGAELSAAWRLVWTTEKETLWLLENGGLFGTAAGESYQVIDVEAGSLNNIITFPPGGLFNVDSDISADGAQRTNFQFTAAALTVGEPFPLLGGRTFNLPPKGQGWFDTVYMDERIRVAKDIRGDTLVVERSDYVIPK